MSGKLLIAALALSGCALLPTVQATRGDALRIGVIAPASGTNAEKGDSVYNGVRLAVAEANAAGGVLGKRLELVTGDDQSNKDIAPNVASNLIAKGVLALVGNVQSSVTKEVLLKQAKPKGVAMVSPASTSPDFSDPAKIDTGGYFFRTIATDALQGKAIAAKAKALGYTKLAILHVDNTYGRGLAGVLARDFEDEGRSTQAVPYPESGQPLSSYASYLTQALDSAPSAIVLIGYPGEGSVILKDWIVSGRSPELPWLFSEALKAQSFVDNVGNVSVLQGKLGTAPYLGGSVYDRFASAYQARFGEAPSLYAANAYDAAMLILLALEQGKEPSSLAVKQNLRAVSDGTGEPLYPGEIAKGLSLIQSGTKVNYEGASGPVDLDERGDVKSGTYVVWRIEGGKIINTDEILSP